MDQGQTMSPGGPTSTAPIGFPALANGEAIPRLAATMIKEGMDFVADRLRADSRTIDEMRCCGNIMDLAALQQRWFAEATQDYSDAATRLFEHAMELASTTLPETTAEPPAAEPPAPPRASRAPRAPDQPVAAE
ncbi:hypothetical protein [Neoroseomonas soli]|uniref:Phasin domain-containing protein n=1 Tax=Neoroseomonas soli TaxID=1081025 RepID=A0A9X9WRC5_9PROT|nr:hypothetical protein [Neoroseomonas soli]MBR0669704.1 hypothetical protein [Neoroseomonas soli]